jgi:hypothetical protein
VNWAVRRDEWRRGERANDQTNLDSRWLAIEVGFGLIDSAWPQSPVSVTPGGDLEQRPSDDRDHRRKAQIS